MGEVTVQACAEFIQLEIERLDSLGPDEKSNAEYFERNTLLYSWLLQRRWLAVRYSELSPLIGATELELGRVTSALRRFIEKSNTKAHRLHSAMELAVEQVFNDPSQHYRILEAVPYFTNVRGFEFLEYLNLLEEPSAMPFASLVMNAFRQALPSVQIAMPFDDLPHVRVVSGQGFSDEWHFILAVFPHYGMLSKDEVDALKGIIFDVRDDLQGKYGILETVVIAPGVNDSGRTSLKRNHHFHFLWGLSSLRFFHLFDTLVHKHRDYFPLVEAEFPVIFDANQPSTIFSIREALDRLDSAVENKKKRSELSVVVVRVHEKCLVFRMVRSTESKTGLAITTALEEDQSGSLSIPRTSALGFVRTQPIKKGKVTISERQLDFQVYGHSDLSLPPNFRFIYPPDIQGKIASADEELVFDVLNVLPELIQIARGS